MSTHLIPERPSIIEQIRAEVRGLPYRPAKRKSTTDRSRPSPEEIRRLFTVEKGNRWMELARRQPAAKQLFGELWHEGELCMLFAGTNTGKSVLAVQIGESIARGKGIAPFACQAERARVLYIDFELTRSQFGLRYSQEEEDYLFSDNFFRAEYNFLPGPSPGVDANELLIAGIEYKVNQAGATVLIIDNITCLQGGTENSAVALSLMKNLKALKKEYHLSILVLAHTPKRRNAAQPISDDDLHGSKLLMNFADSAFAIGKSTADIDLCYLKQIKQRNTRQRYGDDNVCLCRMQKSGTFLQFQFEGYSAERSQLVTRTAADRLHLAAEIAGLSAGGLSQREISRKLGIGLATVNKLLRAEDASNEGCAEMKMHECADDAGSENEKCVKAAPAGKLTIGETLKAMQPPNNAEHVNKIADSFPADPLGVDFIIEDRLTGDTPVKQVFVNDVGQKAAYPLNSDTGRGVEVTEIDETPPPVQTCRLNPDPVQAPAALSNSPTMGNV
ncbi:AAA family ATPase [Mucilaginibacter sp. L3T2-6]|uniref:AAA family ATPase n=1 Tax=Mucilaginibacter sp. L3T2-6 TaxID=3062491 RepID=UPI0026770616|nr:AAA family ATPase [Mucilaginibacter sp. L3T2-6]MDO3643966.1 AAA family ATPase [Mucilaginibacter sp. L3T2-6]MDV6216311.1 AAA family ATPase [Mucilaginibacter sp. L3T2-6]